MIDLHVHTTASDGVLTPEEVVRLAAREGLRALAITDHDTTAGVAPAQASGAALGVRVIAGVELATVGPWGSSAHLLGYCVEPSHPGLRERLAAVRADRETRAERMVARLAELGIELGMEELRAEAGGDVLARPHLARRLVARGFAEDEDDAFARFLRRGAPAWVGRKDLPLEEGIALVRAAGGVPVLAHPGLLALRTGALHTWVARLSRRGLAGLEASHTAHTDEQELRFLRLAERLNLIVTAGSDFHGPGCAGGQRLGHATEGRPIPDELLDALAPPETVDSRAG